MLNYIPGAPRRKTSKYKKKWVAALSSAGSRFIQHTASGPPRAAESWQGTGVSGKLQGCLKLEILEHQSVKFVVICALQFKKNSFAGVCPRLRGRKPWRALPPLTQLQLTTVWSDCWLPNRSSCQDSRDSRLSLSSSCYHPLRSWFMEEDLREELAAKTLRLNKSFRMGSVSSMMFS